MAKVIVQFGYTDYVMDAKQALLVVEALSGAEKYERKYFPMVGDVPGYNTHHIYPLDANTGENMKMQLLPDESYRLYKLAGKPKEN